MIQIHRQRHHRRLWDQMMMVEINGWSQNSVQKRCNGLLPEMFDFDPPEDQRSASAPYAGRDQLVFSVSRLSCDASFLLLKQTRRAWQGYRAPISFCPGNHMMRLCEYHLMSLRIPLLTFRHTRLPAADFIQLMQVTRWWCRVIRSPILTICFTPQTGQYARAPFVCTCGFFY